MWHTMQGRAGRLSFKMLFVLVTTYQNGFISR
jgi:hypothetical protein